MLNDLHIHSSFSDGAFTPEELLEIAREKGIRYISITDHDTLNAYDSFRVDDTSSVRVIPGLEVSTYYKGREIHLLSYFHDPYDRELRDILEKIKTDRVDRYDRIMENLRNLGLELPTDLPPLDSYGRAHIAKMLVSQGYVRSFQDAFDIYLDVDKLAYEKRFKIDTRDAITLLVHAGGIPVLAHPGEKLYNLHFEDLLKELKAVGLLGIEVYHPAHKKELSNRMYGLARKYGLVITGGSDFHGYRNGTADILGRFGVNDKLLKRLLNFKEKRERSQGPAQTHELAISPRNGKINSTE